jgi:carbamoyl-phosphate synthase small subunit
MDGLDLASRASTPVAYQQGTGPLIVAFDFGLKRNIVRMLEKTGFRVEVVPAETTADAVLARHPDGLFLSNGPGDPAAIDYARRTIRTLADTGLPTFGICLGHQLLGLAYGGSTSKMSYGHRGGNHPVLDLESRRVLITTQNHGFTVNGSPEGVSGAPDLEVTHVNLNDGTVEGLRHRRLPVFAVQYHPEAAPGPHDAYPHFGQFLAAVRSRLGQKSATS